MFTNDTEPSFFLVRFMAVDLKLWKKPCSSLRQRKSSLYLHHRRSSIVDSTWLCTWFRRNYVKKIIANFCRKLFIVRKCIHYIDEFTLKTLYLTYLRATIEYMDLHCGHRKVNLKLITFNHYKTKLLHYAAITLRLKISKIGVFVTISFGIYFSILHNFTKLDATNLFNVNMRNNRRGNKLSLNTPIIRTSVFKYALPQRGILQWYLNMRYLKEEYYNPK